ncbi:acetoin utilization protein AcuB [Bacillus oleivorans]|uniref:Acetoin utilization protein AcuB n=1 Tax=Bacillus oleivorans TaxID=1448271 RepID=A0A285CUX3_9BACI|nr:acetoin utilization AcuB family protein [Bacillus oleivorans]SNX71389.1 acetoin utilization protein AcuB [Bacillus oleivorans]
MIVEEVMKHEVWKLSPKDTIKKAIQLMDEKNIRHIPIEDEDGCIAGIISDRDIKEALSSDIGFPNNYSQILEHKLEQIMIKEVITAHPLDFVEEVASLFYENQISCIPIVSNKKMVGIVTKTDILYTFLQLTGALQPGSKIEVKVPNRAGMLSKAAAVISDLNVNIHSVLVNPFHLDESFKILVFRVQTMNPTPIVKALKEQGFDVLLPYTWVPLNE